MRHVFHKSIDRLKEEERWLLERYLNMSKDLEQAYHLKESYRHWFQKAKEIGATEIKTVKNELNHFLTRLESSGISELQDIIKTFKNWQTEILNSFVYDYSNGFLEGINHLTKVIKRNAYGFRNFERFRARILLLHQYKRIGNHVG